MSEIIANCTTKIRPLCKELQKKAEAELHEDPERIENDIEHLKNWFMKQPHLSAKQDNHFLLCFLRGCKFSLQKTKEKLDYYHSVRTLFPELFGNRDPLAADIQRVLKAGAILPLSQTNGLDGPRIVLIRFSVCNPIEIPYNVLAKTIFMILDILMNEDENATVAGVHYIVDIENFSPNYVLQLTPAVLHRSATVVQAGFPMRIKKIDFLNMPKVFEAVLALIKAVLSKKLNERITIYSNKEKLLANGLTKSILPVEYGGTNESVNDIADKWKKKVESYQKFFEEDSKYCSNEALRPDVTNGDSFGVDGTFRRLNID